MEREALLQGLGDYERIDFGLGRNGEGQLRFVPSELQYSL